MTAALANANLLGMKLSEFLTKRGSASELAEQINVPQAMVSQWKNCTRRPNIEQCFLIEKATEFNVTRQELRPDVNWQLIGAASIRNTSQESD